MFTIEVSGSLILRKDCSIANGVLLYASAQSEVGERVQIQSRCVLADANHGMNINDIPMQASTPNKQRRHHDWRGCGNRICLCNPARRHHRRAQHHRREFRREPRHTALLRCRWFASAKVIRDRRGKQGVTRLRFAQRRICPAAICALHHLPAVVEHVRGMDMPLPLFALRLAGHGHSWRQIVGIVIV